MNQNHSFTCSIPSLSDTKIISKPADNKCVILLSSTLAPGPAANTAAMLLSSLCRTIPSLIGEDVQDKAQHVHSGLLTISVPVLKCSPKNLIQIAGQAENSGLFMTDFTVLAQSCRTYPEFISRMSQTAPEELEYLGAALYGNTQKVNHLSGSLPLYR